MKVFLFFSILFSSVVHAKLLDKIVAIVDDNTITLSQVNRINKNMAIKKNVAPMIFDKASYTNDDILNISVNTFLIRSKLSELGYSITDDQVESQIKSNEKRLNVDRKALMSFLNQQGSTFDEYFETLRQAIEYSYFINRVITPTIAISEQDVKNTYFKKNIKDSRLNFKYTLIDYSLPKDSSIRVEKNQFEDIVKKYRLNGVLPENFSALSSANLDDITEDGLNSELRSLLKNTDEGALSNSIVISDSIHVFYVTKKNLVESEAFTSSKDKIREDLFETAVKNEVALWFEREKNKHFIKVSL